MNCPNCGAPVSGSEKFCASCGTPLNQQPTSQFNQQAAANQPNQQTSGNPFDSFTSSNTFQNMKNTFNTQTSNPNTMSYVVMGAGIIGLISLFLPAVSVDYYYDSASVNLFQVFSQGTKVLGYIDGSFGSICFIMLMISILGAIVASGFGIYCGLKSDRQRALICGAILTICGFILFIMFEIILSQLSSYSYGYGDLASIGFGVYMLIISGIVMAVSAAKL